MNVEEVVKALEGLKDYVNEAGKGQLGTVIVAIRQWPVQGMTLEVKPAPEEPKKKEVSSEGPSLEEKPVEEPSIEDRRQNDRDPGEAEQREAEFQGLPVLKQ
jgi:hypothetical protein